MSLRPRSAAKIAGKRLATTGGGGSFARHAAPWHFYMTVFYLLLLGAGLAGGLLAGLLGIGGGIFFLLVLPDALRTLGVAPADMAATVVANSLVGTLLSALAAGYQHVRTQTPGRADIAWVGLPAAVTAYLSLQYIVSRPEFSEQVFNRVVVVILALLLGRTLYTFLRQSAPVADASLEADNAPAKLATTGTLAGLVSSLTGLGGGILIVPVLREWASYPVRRAAFVSSGAIVLSSLAALVFSLSSETSTPLEGSLGYIVPGVAAPLGVGVVLAAPYGVRLATRLSSRTLTLLYILFVTAVLVRRGMGAF